MRNKHVLADLAAYRDLNSEQRAAVAEHVAHCPACARAWRAYQLQDQTLGELTRIVPSPMLRVNVLAKTIDARRSRSFTPRLAYTVLVVFLAITLSLGGTLSASAGALPGDVLYPVKRVAEQVQLGLTLNADAKAELVTKIAATRRDEVRQVVDLGRTVEVDFEGRLDAIEGTTWIVDGLAFEVPDSTLGEVTPSVGYVVKVQATVAEGAVTAAEVRVSEPVIKDSPATPVLTAVPSHTATEVPTNTVAPSVTPKAMPSSTARAELDVRTVTAAQPTLALGERVQTKQADLHATRLAATGTAVVVATRLQETLTARNEQELREARTATARAQQTRSAQATERPRLADTPTAQPTPTLKTEALATPTKHQPVRTLVATVVQTRVEELPTLLATAIASYTPHRRLPTIHPQPSAMPAPAKPTLSDFTQPTLVPTPTNAMMFPTAPPTPTPQIVWPTIKPHPPILRRG